MENIYLKFTRFSLFVCFFFLLGASYAQTVISIEGAGEFNLHPTQYGPAMELGDTLHGEVFVLSDGQGGLGNACSPVAEDLTGKIVFLNYIATSSDANYCSSAVKVANIQDAGAKAAIFVTTSNFPANYKDINGIGEIPFYILTIPEAQEILDAMGGATGDAEIFYFYEAEDEVYWSEDFSEGFNGPNGEWTSVNTFGHDSMVWEYSPTAVNNGWFRAFMIDSPTRSNGVAIMDNGAYLSHQGTVEPPFVSGYGDVGAYLISPVIDLSEAGPITLKWYQYAAGLNRRGDSHVGFAYSVDGGINWSDRKVIDTKTVANQGIIYNPEIVRVFLPEAAGVEEFMFRIEFRSDLYMMMVDDIEITGPINTDLAIVGKPYYTPANYTQPSFAIAHDEFFFAVEVENKGAESQANITMKVEIINESSGAVVETIEEVWDGILPVQETEEILMNQTYFPTDLATGTYIVRYTIIPEEADEAPLDNIAEIKFAISDNKFSMTPDDATYNSWYTSAAGNTKGIGNIFTIPAEVTEKYEINEIQVGYRNTTDADVSNKYLNILVTTVADDILEDWSNWQYTVPEDPFNTGQLNQIAFQEFNLAGKEHSTLLSIPMDKFVDANDFQGIDKIVLENGKRYIIWNIITDPDIGVSLSATYQFERSRSPMIFSGDDSRYYAYFTGGSQAAITMTLELSTTVDNIPLPEEAMNVYPNPVAGSSLYAHLKFDEATDATITLADMNGVVHSYSLHKNVSNQVIENNISDLPAGMYLIRLSTKNGSKTMKFIKQ